MNKPRNPKEKSVSTELQLYNTPGACRKLSISRPTFLRLVKVFEKEKGFTPVRFNNMLRFSEEDLVNFTVWSKEPIARKKKAKNKTVNPEPVAA